MVSSRFPSGTPIARVMTKSEGSSSQSPSAPPLMAAETAVAARAAPGTVPAPPASTGGSERVARYNGTIAVAATAMRMVALSCNPTNGSSTNPAARLPPTAPAVLARYSIPARRPTDCSAR